MYPFNVRVYGLLTVEQKRFVVLCEETIKNQRVVKFPGGGLEFGEGTTDGLIREFKEELDLDVEIECHCYTTDFFERSAFSPKEQILSIYYYVRSSLDKASLLRHFDKIHLRPPTPQNERFSLVERKALSPTTFAFPIDRYVVKHFLNERTKERG